MWNEITGGQIALLYDGQKAWMQEMIGLRSHWKLGKFVKHIFNNTPGQTRDNTFICKHCGREVSAVAPGARLRSHCPHCLWSLHAADDARQAACLGRMAPVALSLHADAWSVVHRCQTCAATQVHSIAVDDNGGVLLAIAVSRPSRTPAGPEAATTGPPRVATQSATSHRTDTRTT